jgi:hypothetical protein
MKPTRQQSQLFLEIVLISFNNWAFLVRRRSDRNAVQHHRDEKQPKFALYCSLTRNYPLTAKMANKPKSYRSGENGNGLAHYSLPEGWQPDTKKP